mgnify:CR=1 FL=1
MPSPRPVPPRPRGWISQGVAKLAELYDVDDRTVRRAVKRYGPALAKIVDSNVWHANV